MTKKNYKFLCIRILLFIVSVSICLHVNLFVHASQHAESLSLVHLIDKRKLVLNTTRSIYPSIGELIIPTNNPDDSISGTGFVVGKNTFVTAKHVAVELKHDKPFNKKGAKYAWFYPGINHNKKPYGKFKIISVVNSKKNDISIITVSPQNGKINGKHLGDVVNPLTIKRFSSQNKNATISGYPADKNDTMWSGYGKLRSNSFQLYYKIDTSDGESGSPIYDASKEVIGVHLNGESYGLNSGDKVTDYIYNFINKNAH